MEKSCELHACIPGFLLWWLGSCIIICRHMLLTSIPPIRMLVLSFQQPSRHFSLSDSTATRNHLEISYSCLVGGLGACCLRRICSQLMAIVGLLPPENYNYAIVPGVGPLTTCEYYRLGGTNSTTTKAQLHHLASSIPKFE
jgi:hypothetical protein